MATTELRPLANDLRELVELPGPAGAEDPVANWITRRLTDLSLAPERDSSGNVRLVRNGSKPRVLITAHMDQVGYMVSRVERDRAYCLPVGKPDVPGFRSVDVQVLGDGHPPFLGRLDSSGSDGGVVWSDRINEIQIGDRVIFAQRLDDLDDGKVRGPALDDRIGCLIVLQAASVLAPDDQVAFGWTVREETEQAGVIRLARELEPEAVIAVDITYAASSDEIPDSVVAVGEGPAITLLDGGMVGHGPLVRAFDAAAHDLQMRWQREVVRSGVSEAGRVQQSLGIPSLALLVPIENPHSHMETAELRDVAAATALLIAGVRQVLEGPASFQQNEPGFREARSSAGAWASR